MVETQWPSCPTREAIGWSTTRISPTSIAFGVLRVECCARTSSAMCAKDSRQRVAMMFEFLRSLADRKRDPQFGEDVAVAMKHLLRSEHDAFVLGSLLKYPGVLDAIERFRREGAGGSQSAAEILSVVIAAHIEGMAAQDREDIITHLDSENTDPPSSLAGIAKLFTEMVRAQEDAHLVHAGTAQEVLREVVGAAEGKSFDERSTGRIEKALLNPRH